MKDERGDYIETFTGKKFHILDPQPEDIDIIDIAHALSMNCRYTGHCRKFYSVAEHSIYVSQLVPEEYRLWGLLHDASEAYLTDVASPIKPLLNNYKTLEKRVMDVICDKYGLPTEMPREVHIADVQILRKEAYVNMSTKGIDWPCFDENVPMVETEIKCYYPEQAEMAFLDEYSKLFKL